MIVIVVICLFLTATIGQASVAYPKNCSIEAISLSAEFLENHSRYVLTLPCFQAFAGCVGWDVMTPIQVCADELGLPQLKDPIKMLQLLGDTKDNYYTALQTVCCVKSKEVELNKLTFDILDKASHVCIDETCGV